MQDVFRPGKDLDMKVRIFESFRDIVYETNDTVIDKVTVNDICKRAGISRRTFYNHFTDKYAVIVWFMETGGAGNFAQIGLTLGLEEAMRALAYTMERYGRFLSACNKSKYYGSIYTYFIKLSREGLEYAASLRSANGDIDPRVKREIRYFVIALDAATTDWVNGVLECTADELADLLVSLVPADLVELLSEPMSRSGFIPWIDATKMQAGAFNKRSAQIDKPTLSPFGNS